MNKYFFITDYGFIGLFILLGGIFGSFATAVSYRIPRNQSFITGHSRCPKCSRDLSFLDLFPVFSWIFTRGKCRYCGAKFGYSYILIELTTIVMFTFSYLEYGLTPETAILCAVALCVVIISAIDFEHYIIPDELNITLGILGIIFVFVTRIEWQNPVIGSIAGLSIGFLLRWLMQAWKKEEGLGMGDVKFLGVAGIFIGFEPLFLFLFMAGITGIITAILWRVLDKGKKFPFGPSLAISLFIYLLYPELYDWWQYKISQLAHMIIR